MKAVLQAIRTKLEKLMEKADELSGSDNEATADKYGDVYGSIESALGEVDAAIERLEE